MHSIEYEIKLNDENRPYIKLLENYEDKPEDKFFAIEIATYIIRNSFNNTSFVLDDNSRLKLKESLDFLLDVGDNMAKIIFDNMRAAGEIAMIIDTAYHIEVKSIEERDALPEKNIAYNDKIFDRFEGLKVYVTFDFEKNEKYDSKIHGVYILKDGITNEHWVKL